MEMRERKAYAFTVNTAMNRCNAPIGRVTSEVTAKDDNNYFVVRRRERYWKFSSR